MAISQEYLEEIWREAKKSLPGWMYATLHTQAKAKAGGRSAHRAPEPSPIEKLALPTLSKGSFRALEDGDLEKVWKSLASWYMGALRKGEDTKVIVRAGDTAMGVIQQRGLTMKSSALGSEVIGLAKSEVPIVFVGASPDESFEFDQVFQKQYLDPLKLSRNDALMFTIIPEVVDQVDIKKSLQDWAGWAEKRLEALGPEVVVALGRAAKEALGDTADFNLPHPVALSKYHDSGEVGRKLRQIAKRLAILDKKEKFDQDGIKSSPRTTGDHPAEDTGEQSEYVGRDMSTRISKADSLKRIVYGVVMDPYGADGAKPDAHNDYLPPATIEAAAHEFMRGERTIGRQHEARTDAEVVESSVEQYPTPEDYRKAIGGLDHDVLRRAFGDDVVHSGSWILGVKLGEDEWKAFESGELNAFSPGGVGYRQEIEPQEMPTVKFIDLVEQRNG